MEPTYRITTERDPTETIPYYKWQARIVRLTDGECVGTVYAGTEDGVIEQASGYIRAMSVGQSAGHVLFATEDGAITHGGPYAGSAA